MQAWHGLFVILTALSLLMGCASSPYVGTGALVGGGLGALTGAAIGHKNPWAGAAIGGLVGTGLGAGTGYLIQQRQTAQPPQGYYQPPPPGYGAPPPQAYGYRNPAPARMATLRPQSQLWLQHPSAGTVSRPRLRLEHPGPGDPPGPRIWQRL